MQLSAVFLVLLQLSIASLGNAGDIVLKPSRNGTAEEVAIILLQAEHVKATQYQQLAEVLQNASQWPLWVGIPEFDFGKFNISSGIERILSSMQEKGMNTTKIFYAAHSPGISSFALQEYLLDNPTKASGQILMGSFLQRRHRGSSPYPVHTLTVSGELDGVCRVTRVMEEFLILLETEDRENAVKDFPTVVVMGMSHFQFASGDPPPSIKELDLKPEISTNQAHATVASIVLDFVNVTLYSNPSALKSLTSRVTNTGVFFAPIVLAYQWEGSYHFKPPCYENPPSSNCTIGSKWTEQAMKTIGGLKTAKLVDTDAFHPADELFPTFHHPQIFNKCASPTTSCVVNLSSVSENVYAKDDTKVDDGRSPTSASEIKAKLKSRQAVMEAAGYQNVSFNISDAPQFCRIINQVAYEYAFNTSSSTAVNRFKKFGVPMVMGTDRGSLGNGAIWIYTPMEYKQNIDSSGRDILEVISIQLKTDVKYLVPIFAGIHYCKLLSPARAIEWIYVDGLRTHLSIKNS